MSSRFCPTDGFSSFKSDRFTGLGKRVNIECILHPKGVNSIKHIWPMGEEWNSKHLYNARIRTCECRFCLKQLYTRIIEIYDYYMCIHVANISQGCTNHSPYTSKASWLLATLHWLLATLQLPLYNVKGTLEHIIQLTSINHYMLLYACLDGIDMRVCCCLEEYETNNYGSWWGSKQNGVAWLCRG